VNAIKDTPVTALPAQVSYSWLLKCNNYFYFILFSKKVADFTISQQQQHQQQKQQQQYNNKRRRPSLAHWSDRDLTTPTLLCSASHCTTSHVFNVHRTLLLG